ncbi:hypothetical protein QBC34DRAFT_404804 [Podospora aff. communis PSN243]|uniref:Gpi-anchored protein n=1 Tax=Podospora aff. communis PSN243 TaxID=3040156 RepID=A0AAV9GRX3_9PEZI|nr:hypothetical protein QBC34DRAFT_404804 [Podospora aff. communis PSN243]
MRSKQLGNFLLAAAVTLPVAAEQAFFPVQTPHPQAKLVRRQDCIPNFYSCADQGPAFNGVCCQNGQRCRLDANSQPACCPVNAVCTGTAPAEFVAPTPTVAFVPNPYFSFPFIATSFNGPGACSQAASQCNANYDACTAQLEGQGGVGGSYQVTIAVPGLGSGGTTIVGGGGVTYPTSSATSICSSLSAVACRNIRPEVCTAAGTSNAGFWVGTGAAHAARPTMACIALAAAGVAGLGLV